MTDKHKKIRISNDNLTGWTQIKTVCIQSRAWILFKYNRIGKFICSILSALFASWMNQYFLSCPSQWLLCVCMQCMKMDTIISKIPYTPTALTPLCHCVLWAIRPKLIQLNVSHATSIISMCVVCSGRNWLDWTDKLSNGSSSDRQRRVLEQNK